MHISFNSIAELDAFLQWACGYRGHTLTEPVVPGVSGSVGGHSVFTAGDGSPADQEAKDLQTGPYDPAFAATPPAGDEKPSSNPEPARRKRRTKAEIEADDKAAAEAEQAKAQGSQDAGEASLEAARATLRDKEQAPTGTNPFAVAAPAAATGAEPAEPADTTVTPFQHLTRAREFIAKHGMPKYNESFAKAGLDANVMAYTAEQRALHLDALAALEGA